MTSHSTPTSQYPYDPLPNVAIPHYNIATKLCRDTERDIQTSAVTHSPSTMDTTGDGSMEPNCATHFLCCLPTILCWPRFFCASHPIRILSASPEQLADSGRAGCECLEREQRIISGDLQLKSCGSFDKPALTSWSVGSFAAGAYPLTCCFFVLLLLLLLPIFLRDYRFFCISRSNGINVKAKGGRANGNTLSFRSLVRFYRYNECLPRWFGCLAGWVGDRQLLP